MAKVLLIDDDDLVQATLSTAVGLAGHTVTTAKNGRDGLRLFTEQRHDVVVTDIIMPDQEGIETILSIRKMDGAVPIIAISGATRMGNLDILGVAQSLGATRVLKKPFGAQDLVDAIKECLSPTPADRHQ
jgi:CheY-like chemotaxis protein